MSKLIPICEAHWGENAPFKSKTGECDICDMEFYVREIDRLRAALQYFGERNNWLIEKDTKWMQFRRPDPHSVTPSNAYINPWEFAAEALMEVT